jgi:phosphate transport system permease protein
VIGETAPLIIICGVTDSVNTNLFSGQMESLPVFIYLSYTQPGLNPDIRQNMAWGAALVLVIIVAALNLIARLAGRLLAPKTGR